MLFNISFSAILISYFDNQIFSYISHFFSISSCLVFLYPLYMLEISLLSDVELVKNLFPFCLLLLCMADGVLCRTEVIESPEGQFIVDLSSCAKDVLFRMSFYILFYTIHRIWFYVDVFKSYVSALLLPAWWASPFPTPSSIPCVGILKVQLRSL